MGFRARKWFKREGEAICIGNREKGDADRKAHWIQQPGGHW